VIEDIFQDTRDRMAKTITALEKDLKRIRTGRASVSLLDGVKANCYGQMMPLNQLSSLSVPESRLIMIQPWDVSIIKEIEKAIQKSDLGLTPTSDGKVIRISIPPLTEQRRKEVVKTVNKKCEEFKVAVRNVRRDANEMFKGLKKDGDISEDEAFKAQDQVQKVTDEYVGQVDTIYMEKEKEILEI